MENSIYKVAFVNEMLFGLCVNKTMMLSDEKPLTSDDRAWFDLRLREADSLVREMIAFLLCDEDHSDEVSLCYSLYRKHTFHFSMLPVRIENALIAIVCFKWYAENGLPLLFSADEAIRELRSLALKQNDHYSRQSNF